MRGRVDERLAWELAEHLGQLFAHLSVARVGDILSRDACSAGQWVEEGNRDVKRFPEVGGRKDVVLEGEVAAVWALRLDRMMGQDDDVPAILLGVLA